MKVQSGRWMHYCFSMEKICSQCHARMAATTDSGHCPACGGTLLERPSLQNDQPLAGPPRQVDHRGILLPRRHALGGVITPQ
jgi:hypothetical protein